MATRRGSALARLATARLSSSMCSMTLQHTTVSNTAGRETRSELLRADVGKREIADAGNRVQETFDVMRGRYRRRDSGRACRDIRSSRRGPDSRLRARSARSTAQRRNDPVHVSCAAQSTIALEKRLGLALSAL